MVVRRGISPCLGNLCSAVLKKYIWQKPAVKFLYDVFFAFAKAIFPLIARFNPKFAKGVEGRKHTWQRIASLPVDGRKRLWVHAASLGEFEQVVPILEKIDREHWQVLVTFFSPSGFEQRKDTPLADATAYLPWDTPSLAKKFIDESKPELVLMVKYEFWPNYLDNLAKNQVPTLLVSGAFREDMPFFKWYGRWLRSYLKAFDHFYLQNQKSLELLKRLGYSNATVSGDTRFDRAAALFEQNNELAFMDAFVDERTTLVIGSSWPEDIAVLEKSIHAQADRMKTIIAPHEIQPEKTRQLEEQFNGMAIRWSTLEDADSPAVRDRQRLKAANVLIIDTIGLLTKAYAYAGIAYVGGAMGGTGLHNILEAATFGVPVIIGQHYKKFPEAAKLRSLGGLYSIQNAREATEIIDKMLSDDRFRESTGQICGHWIDSNVGASRLVRSEIQKFTS